MDKTDPVNDPDLVEITFELNTEDPTNVILTIKCEYPMDGDDLINALEELVAVVKSAQPQEGAGHQSAYGSAKDYNGTASWNEPNISAIQLSTRLSLEE